MKTKQGFGLTVKQMVKKMANNSLRIENDIQRNYCWDLPRLTKLIETCATDWKPIPPIFTTKEVDENGEMFYDIFDGQQRCVSIYRFVSPIDTGKKDENGKSIMEYKVKLGQVENLMTLEDGTEYDISGKSFDELHEDIQDRILSKSLSFYSFEGLDEIDKIELFNILNNGKPLTKIELLRNNAKAKTEIKELANHELFKDCLTATSLKGFNNEDLVMKSFVMLKMEKPCMDAKEVTPFIVKTTMDEETKQNLQNIFTRIQSAHDRVMIKEDKASKAISKKIYTKTHLLSLVRVTQKSLNMDVQIGDFTDFLTHFFDSDNTSINDTYNENCSDGSGHAQNVALRLRSLDEEFNKFFKIESSEQIENGEKK